MQIVTGGDLNQQVKVAYKDEIGKLTESFNQMVLSLLSLREKLYMEKYLSHSTLKSIRKVRDNSALKLGGERKYVTALFSDVRGFTAMPEKMSPEEVVEVLNIYLNLQEKIVRNWGGTVDKYVGDEIMAIFEGKGLEINAVRAAIEIQRFCRTLNWAREKLGNKTDERRHRAQQRRCSYGKHGLSGTDELYGYRRQYQFDRAPMQRRRRPGGYQQDYR
jgi:hypothetical protein